MYDFNPIFIEEELIISKEKLERIRENYVERNAELRKLEHTCNEYVGDSNFSTEINYCSETRTLKIELDLETYCYRPYLCANVTFNVQSANYMYFLKDQEAHTVHLDNEDLDIKTWSATLCTFKDAINPKKNFLVDGQLIIHMKAMLFRNPYPDGQIITHSLMPKLLWSRDNKDFVIAVGKKNESKTEIKIHKLILTSWSPVFDRMLETAMTERAQNRLEIIDFNTEVVRAAVEYFYDRDTFKTLNTENLIDLLLFADKYDIQDLKTELVIPFLFRIYPETVVKIANASIMANSPVIKNICIKSLNLYINQNVSFDGAETLDEDIEKELLYDSERKEYFYVED